MASFYLERLNAASSTLPVVCSNLGKTCFPTKLWHVILDGESFSMHHWGPLSISYRHIACFNEYIYIHILISGLYQELMRYSFDWCTFTGSPSFRQSTCHAWFGDWIGSWFHPFMAPTYLSRGQNGTLEKRKTRLFTFRSLALRYRLHPDIG